MSSILPRAEPQECWWGDSPDEARWVMSGLLACTTHQGDLKILFSKLLLAASQGKLPALPSRACKPEAEIRPVASPARRRAAELGRSHGPQVVNRAAS